MSGAVNAVKEAATVLSAPIWMPAKAGFNFVAHGTNPISDLGDSVKTVVKDTKDTVVEPFMKGAAGDQPAVPNIAADDPVAAQKAAQLQRAQAQRQVQVDTLTKQPGRGGTILSDNFGYKV